MTNRWRRKAESESKSDEPEEAVWGDDDATGPEDRAEPESSEDDTGETEPQPRPSSAEVPAADAADSQAAPSPGSSEDPEDEPSSAEPSESTADAAAAEPSARSGDEFDALGAEVAEVLRHTREVADRVRAEADEQARATIAAAEQQAAATIAEAEQQAREHRAATEREIEEARAEINRQLEEAARVLEAAQERDRTLRGEAEEHLAAAVAAREAGREILERATERLAHAQTVAHDLATQVEMAGLEVGPIASELRELAEQYGVLLVGERGAPAHGGVDDDSAVIDLRDSPTPSPEDAAVDASAPESPAG